MSRSSRQPAAAPRRPGGGRTVRLRPANPFDLIRLIGHSQNDPRKAIAELVQNSLDAGARHVTITRARRKKEVILSVLDDGRGIFPELSREEALERIATNVGHSFKRNLSAEGRQRAGKDRLHSWRIAHGSAEEVRTWLRVAMAWGYMEEQELKEALELLDRVAAMLWKLTH